MERRSSRRPESAGHFNRLRAGDRDICLEIFFQLFVKKSKLLVFRKERCSHYQRDFIAYQSLLKEKGLGGDEGRRKGRGEEERRKRAQAWWVKKAPAFTS